MAKAYNQAGSNPAAKAAVAGLLKTKRFSDAAYEVWINVLLSSPVTHKTLWVPFCVLYTGNICSRNCRRGQRPGGRSCCVYGRGKCGIVWHGNVHARGFGAAGKTFKTGDHNR